MGNGNCIDHIFRLKNRLQILLKEEESGIYTPTSTGRSFYAFSFMMHLDALSLSNYKFNSLLYDYSMNSGAPTVTNPNSLSIVGSYFYIAYGRAYPVAFGRSLRSLGKANSF